MNIKQTIIATAAILMMASTASAQGLLGKLKDKAVKAGQKKVEQVVTKKAEKAVEGAVTPTTDEQTATTTDSPARTTTTADASQYRHKLPVNSDQPKPTIVHREKPYSYSAEIDFGTFKQEVHYDADSRTEYVADPKNHSISLMTTTEQNGTITVTLYNLNTEAKQYTKISQSAPVSPDRNKPQKLVVWQGRWCDNNGNGKFWTDCETGITLKEDCDHTYTINIKLEPQPQHYFKIPDGYKEVKGALDGWMVP